MQYRAADTITLLLKKGVNPSAATKIIDVSVELRSLSKGETSFLNPYQIVSVGFWDFSDETEVALRITVRMSQLSYATSSERSESVRNAMDRDQAEKLHERVSTTHLAVTERIGEGK